MAGSRLYHGLDTRFDAPMWGCALAAWLHEQGEAPFSVRAGRTLSFLAAAAALALLLSATQWDMRAPPHFYTFGSVAVALLTALMIADAACTPASLLRPLLSWRPLTFLAPSRTASTCGTGA